jgi:hypothetical protein
MRMNRSCASPVRKPAPPGKRRFTFFSGVGSLRRCADSSQGSQVSSTAMTCAVVVALGLQVSPPEGYELVRPVSRLRVPAVEVDPSWRRRTARRTRRIGHVTEPVDDPRPAFLSSRGPSTSSLGRRSGAGRPIQIGTARVIPETSISHGGSFLGVGRRLTVLRATCVHPCKVGVLAPAQRTMVARVEQLEWTTRSPPRPGAPSAGSRRTFDSYVQLNHRLLFFTATSP